MLMRSVPPALVMIGLSFLVAGNIGGCPFDISSLLPNTCTTCDPNEVCDPNELCAPPDVTPTEKTLHESIFVDVLGKTTYEGTASSCLICHSDHARDILESAHWTWEGEVTNIEGFEGETHGKKDLLNNL